MSDWPRATAKKRSVIKGTHPPAPALVPIVLRSSGKTVTRLLAVALGLESRLVLLFTEYLLSKGKFLLRSFYPTQISEFRFSMVAESAFARESLMNHSTNMDERQGR